MQGAFLRAARRGAPQKGVPSQFSWLTRTLQEAEPFYGAPRRLVRSAVTHACKRTAASTRPARGEVVSCVVVPGCPALGGTSPFVGRSLYLQGGRPRERGLFAQAFVARARARLLVTHARGSSALRYQFCAFGRRRGVK